jgi:hypothetical protein
MKGRPIVGFLGAIDKRKYRKSIKMINQWVVDQKGFDEIRTQVAVTRDEGNPAFVIGDIESMFTNVPRSDVLEWLETQPDSVKGDVLQTLSETNF